jgi:hypothetical protein
MSLSFENDAFSDTDELYTNGILIALAHTGPSWLDNFADRLPGSQGRRTVGYDLTQIMMTPSDTDRSVPDPNDRPYAGVLILGLTLSLDQPTSSHRFKIIAGVVGPASMAEQSQSAFHSLFGIDKAQGWDYQLENEPVLNLVYEYRHKFYLAGKPGGWAIEAIPSVGGWLGNLLTQGQIGGTLRMGFNIPDDYGPTMVRCMGHVPPPPNGDKPGTVYDWGFSIYGGGIANLVLRDITLDGNTFRDSPSVDKKFFVPAAGVGISIGSRKFLTSFTYFFWGKEFEGQEDYSKFGAIAFSWFF